MVGSIGAYASDILQYMQISSNATTGSQTVQGTSFEELIGNGRISTQENTQSTGITTMGGLSTSDSSANETYSEMDLNQDGQVTIDEIMRYTEMQMMEKMQEQLADAVGDENKTDENEKKSQNDKFDMNSFKTQLAAKAYQMGETLLNTSISAVTQNFAV